MQCLHYDSHCFTKELEHTAATLAAMDVSDEVLKDAKTEFQGQKASHKRYASAQILGHCTEIA